jgi:hypothetical protein
MKKLNLKNKKIHLKNTFTASQQAAGANVKITETYGAASPGASPSTRPSTFMIILFLPTMLLTGISGISLHVQWPPTSRLHGSFLKEYN